jgi:RimJ/RimL family protein N-acetyltransferase
MRGEQVPETAAHAPDVTLRDVTEDDLSHFFEHQIDPDAARMAAFPSRDREAHMAHWHKVLANSTNVTRTIVCDGQVAGNMGSWVQDGDRLIGYWLGKSFWGRGIATAALSRFLTIVQSRPLYAHVVRTNRGSIRVLEKCGFTPETGGADDPEELLMVLTH